MIIIDSVSSEILSVDMQLSENPSPQEVPSSPTLKRARNSFSNFSPPFYIAVEDNYTYRVSIDHEWEEAPVDVVVPKVTVKQVRKASLPFTEMTSKHQVRYISCILCMQFLCRKVFNFYNYALKQSKQKWCNFVYLFLLIDLVFL